MRHTYLHRAGLVIVAAVVAFVPACSSSDDSGSSASSAVEETSNAATTDGGQAPTAAAAPRSGTPGAAGIPQISADATDLAKQPTIAAGTGTPPTELLIADLVTGNGRTATAADSVDVRYVGTLYRTGEVFDASWKQGTAPISFSLAEVVPGFTQGIAGMKVGGRREIVIPPALGYGDTTSGPIPGGSTLVFVVDLVGIS